MPDGMTPEIPAGTPVVDAAKDVEPSDGSKVPLESGLAEGPDVVDLGDLGPPKVAIDFAVAPNLQPGETTDAAPAGLSVGSYSPDTDPTIGSYVPTGDVARAEGAASDDTGLASEPLASDMPAIDEPPGGANAAPVGADVTVPDTPPAETAFDELGSAHPEMFVPAETPPETAAEKPAAPEPKLQVAEESRAAVVSEDAARAEAEVAAADAPPAEVATDEAEPGDPEVSAPDETPTEAAEEPASAASEAPAEAGPPAEAASDEAAPAEAELVAADAPPAEVATDEAEPGDPEVSAPDETPVAAGSEDDTPSAPEAPTPDQTPSDAAPEETVGADEPDTQDVATASDQSTEIAGTVAAGVDAKADDIEIDDRIDGPAGSDTEIAELAAPPLKTDVDTNEHRQAEDDQSAIGAETDGSVGIDTLENEDAPDIGPSGGLTDGDEKIEPAGDDGHSGPIVFGIDDCDGALPDDSKLGDWADFTQLDGPDSAADAGNQTLTLENGDVVSRDGAAATLDGDSSRTVTFSQDNVLTFEEAKRPTGSRTPSADV